MLLNKTTVTAVDVVRVGIREGNGLLEIQKIVCKKHACWAHIKDSSEIIIKRNIFCFQLFPEQSIASEENTYSLHIFFCFLSFNEKVSYCLQWTLRGKISVMQNSANQTDRWKLNLLGRGRNSIYVYLIQSFFLCLRFLMTCDGQI